MIQPIISDFYFLRIKEQHSKGFEGEYFKYSQNKVELSIDEISEVFLINYDPRWIVNYTFELLTYKLFETDNFELYNNLINKYQEYLLENSQINVDYIYERSIKILMSII